MAMTDLWTKRREKLEQAVKDAVMDLFGHASTAAFRLDLGSGLFVEAGPEGTNLTQPAQAAWRDDVLNALRGLKCPHDGRSGDVYEKAAAHVWGDAIITAMRTVQNLPASPTPGKEG